MREQFTTSESNRVQDPAKLKRPVVELISRRTGWLRAWTSKGDAYEKLLAKGADYIKSGAGQYFTQSALVDGMVNCVRPQPSDAVLDPTCGTGGFPRAAQTHASSGAEHLDSKTCEHLRDAFIRGTELVDDTARLGVRKLLLHGIGKPDGDSLVTVGEPRCPADRA